jgi:hypothetical protein
MAITPKFNISQVKADLQDRLNRIEQAAINRLIVVGEKFVANARNNHTYKDQTGNLTSSIGYLILKDGQQIEQSFIGKQAIGKAKGLAVAEEVSEKYPKGLVLIVVAGMEYAGYVESKNYDVITASGITAENDLRKSLAELSNKLK